VDRDHAPTSSSYKGLVLEPQPSQDILVAMLVEWDEICCVDIRAAPIKGVHVQEMNGCVCERYRGLGLFTYLDRYVFSAHGPEYIYTSYELIILPFYWAITGGTSK
jgi:hypothetical protein